ncbi:pollen-specific leucine-rich repeat extensin-like protein 3 [Iris pallida]|uniref:Pollen-specific leucine-rich repeat extensin-like protein 3 n=1 Tax=Iris pallida TaxID=29817 RepID=A0AAX6HNV9_IRIPA|nr:pollen-specific leucine-rich repeat extensin-like protein 3 [Iris pallida]
MIVESSWNLTLLGYSQNPHFYGTYTVGLSPESPFLWDLHCWVIPRIPIFMGLTLLGYPQNPHFYGTTMYHLRGQPPFRGLSPSGSITFGVCYIASYNITWLDPCVLIGGTGEYYMFILYSDSLVTASSLCIVDISITVLSLFLYCTSSVLVSYFTACSYFLTCYELLRCTVLAPVLTGPVDKFYR